MPTNEDIEKLEIALRSLQGSGLEEVVRYVSRLIRIERLRGARDELYSWSGLAEYNAVLERLKELNRQLEEAEREA